MDTDLRQAHPENPRVLLVVVVWIAKNTNWTCPQKKKGECRGKIPTRLQLLQLADCKKKARRRWEIRGGSRLSPGAGPVGVQGQTTESLTQNLAPQSGTLIDLLEEITQESLCFCSL